METQFSAPVWVKHLFSETWVHPLHLARRALRSGLRRASIYATGNLLDVGCGNQRYRNIFDRVSNYLGVDLPTNSAASTDLGAFASGLALPFGARVFDTVLCTEVLEHVPEPQVLLHESAQVLKTGGFLVLTTPQTWGLHEVPHDYYRYTEYGLRYLAAQAGLQVISVTPTCGLWSTVGQRTASFFFFEIGGHLPLPFKAILALALIPWQISSAALDALCHHRGDTLDNVLVAQKI